MIAVYEEAIGRRGSLQSVALADIAAQLRSLADMARLTDLDPAKVHLLLLRLLTLLVADGARLTYHGDFDWGGVRIANALRERFSWQPWRFDTPAYQHAVASVTGGVLTGRPPMPPGTSACAPALEQHGVHIQEELVLPDL